MLRQGFALHRQGDLVGARAAYQQVLALEPRHFDALQLSGAVALQTQDFQGAVDWLRQAIALNPRDAAVHSNLGNALKSLGRMEEALASYDRAIVLQADHAEALNNRGVVLEGLRRWNQALADYRRALEIRPDYADAWFNLGNVLRAMRRFDEAVASCDRAIALRPRHAEAFISRGASLHALKRLEEARTSYAQALAIKPDSDILAGTVLNLDMHLCRWDGLSERLAWLRVAIERGARVVQPFALLALIDDPALQRQAAFAQAATKHPATGGPAAGRHRDHSDKLRIGYYSADFHAHATMHLMAETFEAHDRGRFELYAFSFGPDKSDDMRQRVVRAFDRFIDVSQCSDAEIVAMSRELGIDIAVDLKGFTLEARTDIFAARCAPVQVNYLGYPGTMAAPYFDYIVADPVLIPPDCRAHYDEKVAYLPPSYMANDSRRPISPRAFTRRDCGLPEGAFVFCCFNNNYKVLPATFDIWMRLLLAVEGSVLWLLEDNPVAARNLRREAQARGVDAARLVFAGRVSPAEHLARHRLADLFLDTWPYNAHTTASDALWAGLPLVTLIGRSFASRVAASLLTAIGLSELIAETPARYETLAIELAVQPERLSSIRQALERRRATSALFDGRAFARRIEVAFEAMQRRQVAGLAPDDIDVDALLRE